MHFLRWFQRKWVFTGVWGWVKESLTFVDPPIIVGSPSSTNKWRHFVFSESESQTKIVPRESEYSYRVFGLSLFLFRIEMDLQSPKNAFVCNIGCGSTSPFPNICSMILQTPRSHLGSCSSPMAAVFYQRLSRKRSKRNLGIQSCLVVGVLLGWCGHAGLRSFCLYHLLVLVTLIRLEYTSDTSLLGWWQPLTQTI